jgi:hypothetical protein
MPVERQGAGRGVALARAAGAAMVEDVVGVQSRDQAQVVIAFVQAVGIRHPTSQVSAASTRPARNVGQRWCGSNTLVAFIKSTITPAENCTFFVGQERCYLTIKTGKVYIAPAYFSR